MPAAEVNSYELAFHVLPTVAEGEVPTVFQNLKDLISKHGGELTLEEAPARVELAYEIEQYLEGRNRKFASAYFGWVRFTMEPANIEELMEAVAGQKELLRHLLIKLTKAEEENPFFYHAALADDAKVETIEIDEESASVTPAPAEAETEDDTTETETEEASTEESASTETETEPETGAEEKKSV